MRCTTMLIGVHPEEADHIKALMSSVCGHLEVAGASARQLTTMAPRLLH
jgi:hypothetical protein